MDELTDNNPLRSPHWRILSPPERMGIFAVATRNPRIEYQQNHVVVYYGRLKNKMICSCLHKQNFRI